MSLPGLIWTEYIITEHRMSLTARYMPRTSRSCSRSCSVSADSSALFKLVFSHAVFLSLLVLSFFCHFTYLLFHTQLPPPPFRSSVLSHAHEQRCRRGCALHRADVSDNDAEFWAVPSELCVSLFLSVSLSHHTGYAVTAPQTHTSVSFRQIMPSKTM